MESTFQTNTKAILDYHLSAFVETDVDELMKDYTEGSELFTPQ